MDKETKEPFHKGYRTIKLTMPLDGELNEYTLLQEVRAFAKNLLEKYDVTITEAIEEIPASSSPIADLY